MSRLTSHLPEMHPRDYARLFWALARLDYKEPPPVVIQQQPSGRIPRDASSGQVEWDPSGSKWTRSQDLVSSEETQGGRSKALPSHGASLMSSLMPSAAAAAAAAAGAALPVLRMSDLVASCIPMLPEFSAQVRMRYPSVACSPRHDAVTCPHMLNLSKCLHLAHPAAY